MKPFYPGIIKKGITAFGKLFSDIRIERMDDKGNVIQTIAVPIAYSNKQKWLTRYEQDPNLENYTLTSMPRMGFEITSYTYDGSRKANKNTRVQRDIAGDLKRTQYTPVPYNIGITLYLQTKNVEDGLQCMEQIIPYFTPEYSIPIVAIESMDIINDIPLTLNSVSVEDDYEGEMGNRRSIIHTFDFTMKVNLFGPITSQGVITQVHTRFPKQDIEYHTAAVIPEDVPNNLLADEWLSNL